MTNSRSSLDCNPEPKGTLCQVEVHLSRCLLELESIAPDHRMLANLDMVLVDVRDLIAALED